MRLNTITMNMTLDLMSHNSVVHKISISVNLYPQFNMQSGALSTTSCLNITATKKNSQNNYRFTFESPHFESLASQPPTFKVAPRDVPAYNLSRIGTRHCMTCYVIPLHRAAHIANKSVTSHCSSLQCLRKV